MNLLIEVAVKLYQVRATRRRAAAAEQRRQTALAYGAMLRDRLISECVARECTPATLAHVERFANGEVSA
jgi:hypothetical protein